MLIAQWKSSKPDTAYAGVKPEAFPDRSCSSLLSGDNISISQDELNLLSANWQHDRDRNYYRYNNAIPAWSELVSPNLVRTCCASMANAFGLAPMILQPSRGVSVSNSLARRDGTKTVRAGGI
jgi:hypothetical protein